MGRPRRSQVRVEPRSGVRAAVVFSRRVRPGDTTPGWQRRDERHPRPAGHHRVGLRVELSAHLLEQCPERTAHWRHTPGRHAECGSAVDRGGRRAEHPRHSVHGAVSEHPADVPHRRLPATGLADEHGIRLQYRRHRGRGFADLAERPPHAQDGIGFPVGAAQRRPAAVSDRTVHVQRDRERPARRRQHRHAARKLPARPGAAVLHRPAARTDSGAGPLPGVLHPGRLEGVQPSDHQSGPAVHAEFSLDGNQRSDRRLQSPDPAARLSRDQSRARR